MRTHNSKIQSVLVSILVTTILISRLVVPVRSQDKPIVISFGQPNIWSLEQAHYLLARMHRQNLDLKTSTLGELNPNETNARRIDILKTLLEIGVKYDDAVRINNELRRSDKTFNTQRRQELLSRRSILQEESTQLAREIAALKVAKANATGDEEKNKLQSQIEAKTEQKAAVDNQITQINSELQGLTTVSGNFETVSPDDPFNPQNFPSSALDDLIKAKASQLVTDNPSIAASQRLENHIQMQYEIIAKQLTLLRDEVGLGERLVFLELPQSVNATQDKAENKMAQVWWRIAGYTKVKKEELFKKDLDKIACEIERLNEALVNLDKEQKKAEQDCAALQTQLTKADEDASRLDAEVSKKKKECETNPKQVMCNLLKNNLELMKKVVEESKEAIQNIDEQKLKLQKERARLSQAVTALVTKYEKLKIEAVRRKAITQQNVANRLLQGGSEKTNEVVNKTIELLSDKGKFVKPKYEEIPEKDGREFVSLTTPEPTDKTKLQLKRRMVRTIDIIPRQNALNVNDVKERVNATGIVAAFSFLFGLGIKSGYQRQREQYEQFLNQELYTSGFGKGETDFGWNFYPFAGTKQIAPGVRTTYAVAIIPDDAETIVLQAKGCYLPRNENQPLDYNATSKKDAKWNKDKNKNNFDCNQEQVFILPVPGGGSSDDVDFWVTGIWYSPNVTPGKRIVASIYGQNFSSQMGVLINGVSLTQSVGLAQGAVESIVNEQVRENCIEGICGRFERIDSNQIVISFRMPEDFKKTPKITLIAPGTSVEINNLDIRVNGDEDKKLDESKWMFGTPSQNATLAINDFKVVPDSESIVVVQNNTKKKKGKKVEKPQTQVVQRTIMVGVLSGVGFDKVSNVYVNGKAITDEDKKCNRPDLCILKFPKPESDYITVTLAPTDAKEDAVSKTFVNPARLKIINTSIVQFEKAANNNPAMLTIKLDGSGFSDKLKIELDGTAEKVEKMIVNSSGQMILEIRSPRPVVQITLTDPATNNTVSTVVTRPS